MTDRITLLRHKALRLAKLWQEDGSIADYGNAKWFSHEVREVSSLRELSELLVEIETQRNTCVIRGALKDTVVDPDPDAQAGKVRKSYDYFEDQPLHAVMLDVDSYLPAMCDPFEDPQLAIEEFIVTELPEAFHTAAYHWQLSNTFGHPSKRDKGLKVHLWFWLEHAATSAQMKAWVKSTGLPVDVAVFQPVQPHYTSNPAMDRGVEDPITQRSGLVPGDAVQLDMVEVQAAPAATPRGERLAAIAHEDPIASALYERGLVKSQRADGALNIECPYADTHSGPSVETATVYYPPHTGGFARGNFKCLHAHCDGRSHSLWLDKLELPPEDGDAAEAFEDVSVDTPVDPDVAGFEVVGAAAPASPETSKTVAKPEKYPVQSALAFASVKPPPWIIKHVIPQAEMGVLFGASGSGKSFMALDMAAAVARGEAWRGKKVRKGRVVYVAAEGAGGFRKRLAAYSKANDFDLADLDIGVIAGAPNMRERTEAIAVSDSINKVGGADLVILDTFAQVMPGGNENAGEDVGKALAHCKLIHERTGAMVLLVHHSGKDASKGARGWSGLRAAADVELEVERFDNGERMMTNTKQKDGEDKVEWGFKLQVVDIGEDEDGDPITSCVCAEAPIPVRSAKKEKELGSNEVFINKAFQELLLVSSHGITKADVVQRAAELRAVEEKLDPKEKDYKRRLGTLRTNLATSFMSWLAKDYAVLDEETNTVMAPL